MVCELCLMFLNKDIEHQEQKKKNTENSGQLVTFRQHLQFRLVKTSRWGSQH